MNFAKLLKWFLDILENDGHDIREVKGKLHLAISLIEFEEHWEYHGEPRVTHPFPDVKLIEVLIGKEDEENAE